MPRMTPETEQVLSLIHSLELKYLNALNALWELRRSVIHQHSASMHLSVHEAQLLLKSIEKEASREIASSIHSGRGVR